MFPPINQESASEWFCEVGQPPFLNGEGLTKKRELSCTPLRPVVLRLVCTNRVNDILTKAPRSFRDWNGVNF